MKQYLDLLSRVINTGIERDDRTGTGTLSLFGEHIKINLKDNFPLITTKQVWFKGIAIELLWMLKGYTNIKFLQDNKVHIWDSWANEKGELGPIYGYQWRNYNGQNVDQIKDLIEQIKNNPNSRRLLVITYNPAQLKEMALPPCPVLFQFYINKDKLSIHVYQRSCDLFLGGPFDIASYALLTYIIAKICNLKPDMMHYSFGDAHIYKNHINQVKEQLTRTPKQLPQLIINQIKNIDEYNYDDFQLINYNFYPKINAQISI